MKDSKGYLWPTPIDPGGVRCIKVLVPDDPLYLGEFWQAYEFFTTWLAWERDAARTGKDVAAVWRAAYDAARAMWISGTECDTMTFDLRKKPGEPWVTQASTDGGLTWHDAIEQPHWFGNQQAVYPDISNDAIARDIATQVLRGFHQWVIDQFNAGANSGETKAQTVSRIMDSLSGYGAGATVQGHIEDAYDAFQDVSQANQASYADDCAYQGVFAGIVTASSGVSSGLDALADYLFTTLDWAADALLDALDKAAGAMGGKPLYNFTSGAGFGGSSGAGFATDCTWTHEFDFTVSDGGWVADLCSGTPEGHYSAGVGWVSDTGDWTACTGGNPEDRVYIYVDLPQAAHVTEIIGVFNRSGVTTNALDRLEIGPRGTTERQDTTIGGAGNQTRTFAVDYHGATRVWAAMIDGPEVATRTIVSITVSGTGPDPFI